MKQEEMQKYEVKADSFWAMAFWGYDGYDMMEIAAKKGWYAIAGWGKQGWDLGSWPLVIVFKKRIKDVENCYLVAVYVEGDVTQYATPDIETRNALIDETAFFYWKHADREWVKGYDSVESFPDRGPYQG